jgi:WD40 repeat protein
VVLHGGVCVSGHGKSFGRKKRRFVDMEEDSTGGGDSNDMGDIFSTAKVNWYHSRARGGITQLKWAGGQAGFSLFSASRRSDAILQWDLRMLTGNASFPIRGIAAFPRDGDTNQRLEFDLDKSGRRLFAPSQDGSVKIYDIQSGSLLESIDGFDDAVNGVSFLRNESQQEDILALTVGARRFNECYEDIPTDQRQNDELPGSLQLHRLTQSQNLDG